jgi:hypothetical protein
MLAKATAAGELDAMLATAAESVKPKRKKAASKNGATTSDNIGSRLNKIATE